MSIEQPPPRPRLMARLILPALALLVLLGLAYFFLGGGKPRGRTDTREAATRRADNPLDRIQASLARETDLNTCRDVLQQLNAHLAQEPDLRPPDLAPAARELLQKELFLDPRELAEVENNTYTLMDAHHLATCFLLRDVARSLDVTGVTGAGGKPSHPTYLEKLQAAFAWVVRQVRLEGQPRDTVPPYWALHCGRGNPMDRALVFLALLNQVEIPDRPEGPGRPTFRGCLLLVNDKPPAPPRLWACGVPTEDGSDLYLFDPRLGLPLPGKDGPGSVATLKGVRQGPEGLAPLKVSDKHPYDVTSEQARSLLVLLFTPLSALAPRTRHLETELLPASLGVHPALDAAADREAIRKAVGSDGAAQVRLWKEGTVQLQQFLPPGEGGVDSQNRLVLFVQSLIPWNALPPVFRDESRFPRNSPLGVRVLGYFATPFLSAEEPNAPRDLILRGRFDKAAPELVKERDSLLEARDAGTKDEELDKIVRAWTARAVSAYADRERSRSDPGAQAEADRRIAELWNEDKEAKAVVLLLRRASYGSRGMEVTYLLAQCRHERAEQLQARLDLQARTPGARRDESDVDKARSTWQDALGWWQKYLSEYPQGPGVAAARRMQGRAQAMLGDREGAVASWQDVSGPVSPLEALASLYLAEQARKLHAGAKAPQAAPGGKP